MAIDIEIPKTKNELAASRLIEYKKLWQIAWNDPKSHGRFLYSLHSNVTTPLHREYMSRKEECLIQQLRVGKCRLNFYLCQINQHDDGLCGECGVLETIEHFILQCTKYDEERIRLKQRINLQNPDLKQFLISNPTFARELLR